MTRRSGPRRSARGRRARADSRRWPDTLCRATRPPHWGGLTGRKAGAAGSFPFGAWRSERVGTRRNTAAAVAWAAPAERPAPAHQSALPRARRPGQLSAAASTCVVKQNQGGQASFGLRCAEVQGFLPCGCLSARHTNQRACWLDFTPGWELRRGRRCVSSLVPQTQGYFPRRDRSGRIA